MSFFLTCFAILLATAFSKHAMVEAERDVTLGSMWKLVEDAPGHVVPQYTGKPDVSTGLKLRDSRVNFTKTVPYDEWFLQSKFLYAIYTNIAPLQRQTSIVSFTEETAISEFRMRISIKPFDIDGSISSYPTPYCWMHLALVRVPYNAPVPQFNTATGSPVINDREKVLYSEVLLLDHITEATFKWFWHIERLYPMIFSSGDSLVLLELYTCPLKSRIPLDGYEYMGDTVYA